MGWPYSSRRWRELRLKRIALDPHCEKCGWKRGRMDLHHVNPLTTEDKEVKNERAAFPPFDSNELMLLCHNCHSYITGNVPHNESVRRAKWRAYLQEV